MASERKEVREIALSREEEDLLARSVKKAKSNGEEEVLMDAVMEDSRILTTEEIACGTMVLDSPEVRTLTSDSGILVQETAMNDDLASKIPEPRKQISYMDSLLGFNGGDRWSEDDLEKEDLCDDSEDEDPVMEEDEDDDEFCPPMDVESGVRKKYCLPWRQALIVRILGKRLGLNFVRIRLERLWARNGAIEIVDLENEYYLVRFTERKDFLYAFQEGPWLIADHYLVIQKWRPDFNPFVEEVRKIAVWIRIPGLPIEYYNKHFLWRVGNRVGKTVKIDTNTLSSIHDEHATVGRGRFARICVEVDLRKKLLSKFRLRGRKFSVEYEGLHFVCFECGKFGHRKEQCPEKMMQEKDVEIQGKPDVSKKEERKLSVGKEAFGPWMLVQKPMRKSRIPNPNGQRIERNGVVDVRGKGKEMQKANLNGSRFELIANLGDDEIMVENNLENGEPRKEDQMVSNNEVIKDGSHVLKEINGDRPCRVLKEFEKRRKAGNGGMEKENRVPDNGKGKEDQKKKQMMNKREKEIHGEIVKIKENRRKTEGGGESSGGRRNVREGEKQKDLSLGGKEGLQKGEEGIMEIGGSGLKNPKPPDPKMEEEMLRGMNYMMKNMDKDDTIALLGGTEVYYGVAGEAKGF